MIGTRPRLIQNDAELKEALARIDELGDPAPGTDQAKELESLFVLVEEYEDRVCPMPPSNPIDVLKFWMEQNNLKQKTWSPTSEPRPSSLRF